MTGIAIREHARDWTMQDVELRTPRGEPVRLSNTENIDAPVVRPSAGA